MNPSPVPLTDPVEPAEAVAASTARAIKRRVLDRVAETDESHLTIPADDGWQPFLEGIRIKVLRERDGVMSYLLRLAPGAALPSHRHPADEECVVVEGTLRIGQRIVVTAGGYHLAHEGALHAPVWTETGATIFLRGAVPDAGHVLR